jgi:hypothetical protein
MARSPKKQFIDAKQISQAFGSMFSDVGQAINPFGSSSNQASDAAASQVASVDPNYDPMNDPNVYGSQAYHDKKFFEKHGMTREEKREKEKTKMRERRDKEFAQAKEDRIEKETIRKDAGMLTANEALSKLNELNSPFTIKRNIRRASSRRRRR